MAKIDGPCKNCNERRAACWDKCDKYKSYKAAAGCRFVVDGSWSHVEWLLGAQENIDD